LPLEEPDFGTWLADADSVWATHAGLAPGFPERFVLSRSLAARTDSSARPCRCQGRRRSRRHPGRHPPAEFYRVSMAPLRPPTAAAGALTPEQAAALVEAPPKSDFLACGFVHVGVRGLDLRRHKREG